MALGLMKLGDTVLEQLDCAGVLMTGEVRGGSSLSGEEILERIGREAAASIGKTAKVGKAKPEVAHG